MGGSCSRCGSSSVAVTRRFCSASRVCYPQTARKPASRSVSRKADRCGSLSPRAGVSPAGSRSPTTLVDKIMITAESTKRVLVGACLVSWGVLQPHVAGASDALLGAATVGDLVQVRTLLEQGAD